MNKRARMNTEGVLLALSSDDEDEFDVDDPDEPSWTEVMTTSLT